MVAITDRTIAIMENADPSQRSAEALKARAQALRSLAEASVSRFRLEQVWPDGRPITPMGPCTESEEALWHQCLINFGASMPPLSRAANHLSQVVEAGFDANKVRFPHNALRDNFPKPMISLTPSCDLRACDGNDIPFPITKDLEGGGCPSWLKDDKEEMGLMWLLGLAQHSSDLRDAIHADDTALDTSLDVCSPAPPSIFENCIGPLQARKPSIMDKEFAVAHASLAADPGFFAEHRYLRAGFHSSKRSMKMSFVKWCTLRGFEKMSDVIKNDKCTSDQLYTETLREARSPLSTRQLHSRRQALHLRFQERYGTSVFNHRFFEPAAPLLERDAALAQLRARMAVEEALSAHAYDEAAALGAEFVVWPVAGERRWPEPSSCWTRHCQWFEKWRQNRPCQHLQLPFTEVTKAKEDTGRDMQASEDGENCDVPAGWLSIMRKLSDTSTTQPEGPDSEWESVSQSSDFCWPIDISCDDDESSDDTTECWTASATPSTQKLGLSQASSGKLELRY